MIYEDIKQMLKERDKIPYPELRGINKIQYMRNIYMILLQEKWENYQQLHSIYLSI